VEVDQRICQHGTGTLLKIADQCFLVTAAHVHQDALRYRCDLHISAENGALIAFDGMVHSANNQFDVAAWELSDKIEAEMKGHDFRSLAEIDLSGTPLESGWYLVFGYPCILARSDAKTRTVRIAALSYATVPYAGSTNSLVGYEPEFHLLLRAPREDNVSADGTDLRLPEHLNGISGSSIWRIAMDESYETALVADTARVVAVQTGCYRETQLIKGTRWRAVLALLWKSRPDLRPAILLHAPDLAMAFRD